MNVPQKLQKIETTNIDRAKKPSPKTNTTKTNLPWWTSSGWIVANPQQPTADESNFKIKAET
jgi:hypothetical protein